MPVGDLFTRAERQAVEAAIRTAEQRSRCEFSVFVGAAGDDPHQHATRVHNSLVAPARSIVILVDPGARALEIVYGGWTRARLTDDEVAAVVEEMTELLRSGELTKALLHGIDALARAAAD